MRRTLYALVGYDLINELDNVVYQGHVYMLAIDAAGIWHRPPTRRANVSYLTA